MIDPLSQKPVWNDGPALIDFMGRDDAPPIASKHLCFGGGGGTAPSTPDYSQYISAMTAAGNTDLSRSQSLYDWANTQGSALQGTANTAGQGAGTLAGGTLGTDPALMAKWQQTYLPLYQSQAADAARMNTELPNTENQWAGKYAADTGQAFDAAKASSNRTLQSYGLKTPGIASGAMDLIANNQRAAATTAASETGRLAADTTARGVTNQAIQTGTTIPAIGTGQSTLGLQANQQSVALPATAISTTAGAYSPSLGYDQAAYPYLAQWGQTMSNQYNQQLAQYNANAGAGGGAGAMAGAGIGALGSIGGAYAGSASGSQAISSGFGFKNGGVIKFGHGGTVGDILSTVGRVGGTIVGGIYGGPAGAMIGGKAGAGIGDTIGDTVSGNSGDIGEDVGHDVMPSPGDAMSFMARGGGVTPPSNGNFVPPHASPSRGAITDDVPARLNEGEFVFPKDVVSWRGEQWMQKEIQKAREDRQQKEIAKPEMGHAASGGAINMRAPTFISEGARA